MMCFILLMQMTMQMQSGLQSSSTNALLDDPIGGLSSALLLPPDAGTQALGLLGGRGIGSDYGLCPCFHIATPAGFTLYLARPWSMMAQTLLSGFPKMIWFGGCWMLHLLCIEWRTCVQAVLESCIFVMLPHMNARASQRGNGYIMVS